MIWEHKVPYIVMLTLPKEGGKVREHAAAKDDDDEFLDYKAKLKDTFITQFFWVLITVEEN
jgi:hypothetical protein